MELQVPSQNMLVVISVSCNGLSIKILCRSDIPVRSSKIAQKSLDFPSYGIGGAAPRIIVESELDDFHSLIRPWQGVRKVLNIPVSSCA